MYTIPRLKEIKEKKKLYFYSSNEEDFSSSEQQDSQNKYHNSAADPDKIHYKFLKNLPDISFNYLLEIYGSAAILLVSENKPP